ncbi:hypothetical protein LTR37_018274 [Vermiconidia calcicola]|uniref:Uncharacterized protein n=1 Tax=Vermiconidia calcicola TaxID=1690605 RepID=A0ACC3MHP7_9PEZI|nr:hypothetical protein LTR37_018274 [Vermiconidia calcicola]
MTQAVYLLADYAGWMLEEWQEDGSFKLDCGGSGFFQRGNSILYGRHKCSIILSGIPEVRSSKNNKAKHNAVNQAVASVDREIAKLKNVNSPIPLAMLHVIALLLLVALVLRVTLVLVLVLSLPCLGFVGKISISSDLLLPLTFPGDSARIFDMLFRHTDIFNEPPASSPTSQWFPS